MSKEAYYFSHDSNARNDEKVLAVRMKHGAEGYGIYFMLVERLREESEYKSIKDYNLLAFDFRVSSDKVKSIVEDFKLFDFTEDGKYFYSERMMRNMDKKNLKSNKAKMAAAKRWGNTTDNEGINANAMQTHSEGKALKESKVKESKVKESKGERGEKTATPPLNSNSNISLKTENSERKKVAPKKERFKAPTLEEIHSCFLEKGLVNGTAKLEAQKFFDYYESNGWMIGRTKMKKWKSAASGWVNRMQKFNNGNANSKNNKTRISGRSAVASGDIAITEFTDDYSA